MATATIQIYTENTVETSKERDLVERIYVMNEDENLNEVGDLINYVADHRYVCEQLSNDVLILASLQGFEVRDIFKEYLEEEGDSNPTVTKICETVINNTDDSVYELRIAW